MAPGRNDPCPCGSGQKYKRCCGRIPARHDGPRLPAGHYFRLHVGLADVEPPIWRRFLLHGAATFQDLHEAIQAFGWEDAHLWSFRRPKYGAAIAGQGTSRGLLDPRPEPDARTVPLASELREPGDRCDYVYDFGDDWRHRVVLEAIEQREEAFERALLAGGGAFPPEDCGGPPGFMRLQELWRTGKDPRGADAEELAAMYGASAPPPFDLDLERARFGAVLEDAEEDAEGPEEEQREVEGESARHAPAAAPRKIDEAVVGELLLGAQRGMAEVAEQLGLRVVLRKASYSKLNARLEFEASTVREDGVVMDSLAVAFLERCEEFGLAPEDLGRGFRCGGEAFRVVGLRPRAKEPVVCERLGPLAPPGARVRISAAAVRSHLAGTPPRERSLRLVRDEE